MWAVRAHQVAPQVCHSLAAAGSHKSSRTKKKAGKNLEKYEGRWFRGPRWTRVKTVAESRFGNVRHAPIVTPELSDCLPVLWSSRTFNKSKPRTRERDWRSVVKSNRILVPDSSTEIFQLSESFCGCGGAGIRKRKPSHWLIR